MSHLARSQAPAVRSVMPAKKPAPRPRYGTSARAGTTFTPEELALRGVKKIVLYAQRETWEGIEALRIGPGDKASHVVARLVAAELERVAQAKKAAAKKKTDP